MHRHQPRTAGARGDRRRQALQEAALVLTHAFGGPFVGPLTGRALALGYLSRNTQKDAPLSAGEATVLPIP